MDQHFPWLRTCTDAKDKLRACDALGDASEKLKLLMELSGYQHDFVVLQQIDRRLAALPPVDLAPWGLQRLNVALLSNATIDHLLPSIRVAGLRRGLWVECYAGGYNQYRQEILDSGSALHAFRPDIVVFAFDGHEIQAPVPLNASESDVDSWVQTFGQEWIALWDNVQRQLHAQVIHQSWVISPETVFGQMDRARPATPLQLHSRLNQWLASQTQQRNVLLFDVEALASEVGKLQWCQESLWAHAKQAVSPLYAPLYGDRLARLLAAVRGRSSKVLVLDLDNTLWGGVVGEDGVEGLELGQGSGVGEAYLSFQGYVKRLKERGVVLAVCSKNEEANAKAPFLEHPEMRLRLEDFSVFVANWEDKASNLRKISEQLNLGLDSFVFFDDNPAERALIRQELPMVAVPEIPEDPAEYARALSLTGYFETCAFTADDSARAEQYHSNAQRQELQAQATDLEAYRRQLAMQMTLAPFDKIGESRIAQLINKSNQFNLTTRRYTLAQVQEMECQEGLLTLQISLSDRFGDNGMISVLIARPEVGSAEACLFVDTWLMSCRVLGRQVEEETMNQLVGLAQRHGLRRLRADYRPTPKNGIVQQHYAKMQFKEIPGFLGEFPGHTAWELNLKDYVPFKTHIAVRLDERLIR